MKKILISLVLSIVFFLSVIAQNSISPKLGKDPIKKVIAAMTLHEKVSLVVGTGNRNPGAPPPATNTNQVATSPVGQPTGTVIGETQTLVAGAAGTSYSLPLMGITSMVLTDGPAGVRISPTRQSDMNTYYCTAFPVGTLLASTWDLDLVQKVGKAMGKEVLEYGVDVLLGPGMNIHGIHCVEEILNTILKIRLLQEK